MIHIIRRIIVNILIRSNQSFRRVNNFKQDLSCVSPHVMLGCLGVLKTILHVVHGYFSRMPSSGSYIRCIHLVIIFLQITCKIRVGHQGLYVMIRILSIWPQIILVKRSDTSSRSLFHPCLHTLRYREIFLVRCIQNPTGLRDIRLQIISCDITVVSIYPNLCHGTVYMNRKRLALSLWCWIIKSKIRLISIGERWLQTTFSIRHHEIRGCR